MTQIEILATVTPIFIGGSAIATVLIGNYFDNKAAEAERKAKLSSGNNNAARIASAAE
jgi:hypothetical protein